MPCGIRIACCTDCCSTFLGYIRQACGGAWRRQGNADAVDAHAVYGARLRSTLRRVQLAGDEGALQSHEARLYHLNARPIKRSTLADANASRPVAVFAGLFAKLLGQAHRGLRRALGDCVSDQFHEPALERAERGLGQLLSRRMRGQGPRCPGCGRGRSCVHGGHGGKGERYHRREGDAHRSRRDLCFRPRLLRLRLVGEARRSGLPDRDAAEVETPLEIAEEIPVPGDGAILSDRIGYLPARQANSRKNPIAIPSGKCALRSKQARNSGWSQMT